MRAKTLGIIVTLSTVQSPQQLKVDGTSVESQLFKGYLLPTTQAKTPCPHVERQTQMPHGLDLLKASLCAHLVLLASTHI